MKFFLCVFDGGYEKQMNEGEEYWSKNSNQEELNG